MHRILGFAIIGLAVLAGQAVAADGGRRPTAQLPLIQQYPTQLYSIFGVPVVVDAPVAPPYCNCAYKIVGGQPATGGDTATGLLQRFGG
jgi:hypothetical protein